MSVLTTERNIDNSCSGSGGHSLVSPELLRGQPDTETGHPVIKWYSWANVLNVPMQNIFTNVVYVVRYVKDLVKSKTNCLSLRRRFCR